MKFAGVIMTGTAIWLTVAAGAPQVQLQPVPIFRADVNLVTVDVSVLDGNRRPVRGLTAADFTILENGRPQPVTAFTTIDLPDVEVPSVTWLRDSPPDVQRNDDYTGRRTILLVLDDATPMPAADVLWVKRAARQVIEKLGPDDLAAVVYTLEKSKGQDFTRDRARLMSAVEAFSGGIPLDLSVMSGRVALGDGDAWPGQTARLLQEMLEGFAAAGRANVNIYTLDPGGLRAEASTLNHDFLKAVSANTGGFATTDTSDIEPALSQVFRENGSYYLLGYQAPDPKAEGRFRRIEVRVNRPGVTVRGRNGYFEPRRARRETGASPSPLAAAMSGIAPKVEMPMQVSAAPFAITGKREAAVAVVVGIRTPVPPGPGRLVDNIDVQLNAYDPGGTRRGSAGLKGRVVLRPGSEGEAAYEVISRIDLKPGRYQLRVAAASSLTGKSGSVFYDIDVPDFSKDGLLMSGMILSVDPRVATAPKDGLPNLLPIVPTTDREFGASDRVTAFLRIYQAGNKPLKPVRLVLQIIDGLGAMVFNDTLSFAADRFSPARSADCRIDVPLSLLQKGPHLLSVNAGPVGAAEAGKPSLRREIPFTVR